MNVINPPKVYPQDPLLAYKFDVIVDSIVFNDSASLKVVLYNEKDAIIKIQYLLMQGQAYLDWGSNDDYVIEWVRQQLDLSNLSLTTV